MVKLLATVLAGILGFFGAMLLSHVLRTVMANENIKIERIANMTSFESNNNNVLEVDGIQFTTLVPKQAIDIPQYGEETSKSKAGWGSFFDLCKKSNISDVPEITIR
ncbi:MAG: hypothetical protein V7K27_00965 [Nostoc sp.]|uniref:hypothetical protein n=1 Tax=Nostoc sp. TaxID=1180 RepID=UPI002FF69052